MVKILCCALGLLGAVACGGVDAAPVAGTAEISPDLAAPAVESTGPELISVLELRSDTALAGGRVEAEIETRGDVDVGYTWRLDGRLLSGGDASLQIPAQARKGQRIGVTVVATDGVSKTVRTAQLEIANAVPTWVSLELAPVQQVVPGTELHVVAAAIDADEDPLTFEYQWFVNGRALPADEAADRFSTTGLRHGDRVAVEVRASDGTFETSDDMLKRSNDVVIANRAPRIVSIPAAVGSDLAFRYQVEVEDEDGDRRFRYRLEQAPGGMSIDATGELRWNAERARAGSHRVEVVVADMKGGEARQRFDLEIREEQNASPASPSD